MKLSCDICGAVVSNELPEDVIVKAWVECPKCSHAFPKVDAKKLAKDTVTFTARAVFGHRGERSVTEKEYENLVQRIVDILRKQRDNLPLVILVK